jgi:hypothetical protein
MTQNKRELKDVSPHASLALQVPMPYVMFVPRNSVIPTLSGKILQIMAPKGINSQNTHLAEAGVTPDHS